jgi:hypothetical protein
LSSPRTTPTIWPSRAANRIGSCSLTPFGTRARRESGRRCGSRTSRKRGLAVLPTRRTWRDGTLDYKSGSAAIPPPR